MTIFTPPKRKISLASMVLGTLLMTSLSAGNANASLLSRAKCELQCSKRACATPKTLIECAEKCDYSSIENCVSQNCSKLKSPDKERLASALQKKLSDLEKKMVGGGSSVKPGAALGTGKGAVAMAHSSSPEQVKLMQEIEILKKAMEHCGFPSTSNTPSTPGADTPSVSSAASHEDTTLSPDKAQHEQEKHEEALLHEKTQHEDVNKPADMTPSSDASPPLPPENPQTSTEASSKPNSLLAQLAEGRTNLKSPDLREKERKEDHKPHSGLEKFRPDAQAARDQFNLEGRTSPAGSSLQNPPPTAGEKNPAQSSGTHSGTPPHGNPPPPVPRDHPRLPPPPNFPPPPMGNVAPKELDMRRFDASSGPYMDDHRNAQESQSQHKGPGTSTPHPTSSHIQTPPPPAEEATLPHGRGIPTPPPMGNVTHSQGTAAPKVAAHHGQSGHDDLSAAIKNNPKQNLRKVDPNAPKPEPKPEGIQAALEEALAARRERVKPEESEEQKLTPEEQAAKDKEWE